jgi:hypothetical protein
VAKKDKAKDTLGDIAEGLGTMLGKAEKQWRAWQGPRDNMIKAVTDVRDRAVALLSEMGASANAARAAAFDDSGKKKGKKAKKAKKADMAEKAGKPDKKSGKKAGKKKDKKARKADDAAPADVES